MLALPLLLFSAYGIWSPGLVVRDGAHDRHTNGLWLSHGWLGDDAWFAAHSRRDSLPPFRAPDYIAQQANHWREHHIVDLFPHLAPARRDGRLPGVDRDQVERFLDATATFHTLPWIGGVHGRDVRAGDAKWRQTFTQEIRHLLESHPRLAGVHLNVEPWPDGDGDLLTLLDEMRAAMPVGKILSVAAYPPPTRWHPHPEVHWSEPYFRQVASRCDHLAVMMYDTSIRWQKPYRKLMDDWTREVLTWSGDTPVLLGLPAYEDADVGYHHPHVENLANALQGVHAGLASFDQLPANYRGVALYSDWTTDADEWRYLQDHFLSR